MEFGIVVQQLVVLTMLDVVGNRIEKFKELCHELWNARPDSA